MTTTMEATSLHSADTTGTARAHSVVFSDPGAVKATAVRDPDASAAAQAPVFSNPY
jgi:hypothetical protein